MILSFAFYGSLMLVPFLHFSAGRKLQLSAGLVIMGEASFWIAVLILGKEAVSRFKNIDLRNWWSTALRAKSAGASKGEDNDGMNADQILAISEK